MERRLAAILAIDVVGFSILMGKDEERTLSSLNERRQIIDDLIAKHYGRVFGGAGDSVVAEFASPVNAVRCSILIQQKLAQINSNQSDDHQMRVRIGLNLGDVLVEGENLFGDGVNIAARLEQLAEPGGIFISDDIARQAEGKVEAEFERLGERTLKNIMKPVCVHRVLPRFESETPSAQKPIVGVLPFKNLSNDPEQDYFADGISEDIITGISKNPDIVVISKNTTFTNKQKSLVAEEVYEKYGARFVLEGSVRRSGERTRVSVQLSDMASSSQLWADRFDCDFDDVFELQDEVVTSILHILGTADGVLERTARKLSHEMSADGRTAYDCYLEARGHFYRHGNSGFETAEAMYEKAIDLDPEFARAYSALAWLHFLRFKLFRTKSFESVKPRVLKLARVAHQLDAQDFRAHWVLGGLFLHDGNLEHSLAEFDKALRINSNNSDLLIWSAEALVYAGQEQLALERCKQAFRRNPNCADWYHWVAASVFFHLGQYEDALAELERMSATEYAARMKAATLAHLGRLDIAQREARNFLELVPDFSISDWARTEFYANPKELDRYVDGLRIAGLPE